MTKYLIESLFYAEGNSLFAYVKSAWRGDYSQGALFWGGIVVPVLLAQGLGAVLVVFNLLQDPVLSTRFWLLSALFFICIYLPWAFVVSLRSIIVHIRALKEMTAGLILVVLWGLMLSYCGVQIARSLPVFQRMAVIALEQDKRQAEFHVVDQDLFVDGFIGYGDPRRLRQWLRDYPELNRVVFNVSGGHLYEMRQFARLIAKRKLNTHVDGDCLQNCLIAYAGGYLRTAGPQAHFNFEKQGGYDNGYRSPWIISREQEKDRKFFLSRGVSLVYSFKLFYSNADGVPYEHPVKTLRAHNVINRDQA